MILQIKYSDIRPRNPIFEKSLHFDNGHIFEYHLSSSYCRLTFLWALGNRRNWSLKCACVCVCTPPPHIQPPPPRRLADNSLANNWTTVTKLWTMYVHCFGVCVRVSAYVCLCEDSEDSLEQSPPRWYTKLMKYSFWPLAAGASRKAASYRINQLIYTEIVIHLQKVCFCCFFALCSTLLIQLKMFSLSLSLSLSLSPSLQTSMNVQCSETCVSTANVKMSLECSSVSVRRDINWTSPVETAQVSNLTSSVNESEWVIDRNVSE